MNQEPKLQLIHDMNVRGGQSNVYRGIHTNPEKPICVKMYSPNLSLDIAQSYVDFHKSLNEEELSIDFDEGIDFLGKKVQLLKLSFAKIISDMIICPIDDSGNSVVSSYSEFIEGENLFRMGMNGKIEKEERIKIIEGINETISRNFNLSMSFDYTRNNLQMPQIHAFNTKFAGFSLDEQVANLIITDIACDIEIFVNDNQDRIKELTR